MGRAYVSFLCIPKRREGFWDKESGRLGFLEPPFSSGKCVDHLRPDCLLELLRASNRVPSLPAPWELPAAKAESKGTKVIFDAEGLIIAACPHLLPFPLTGLWGFSHSSSPHTPSSSPSWVSLPRLPPRRPGGRKVHLLVHWC